MLYKVYSMKRLNLKKGSGLVEILVAVFIFSIVLGSLITASNMYLSGAAENLNSAKGAYLGEEGIEAVKVIRDTGWNNISTLLGNVNYYLYFDTTSSTWLATTTPTTSDSNFVRTFEVGTVYRDSNGRIVSTGGTLDLNTKKITVSISWQSKNSTTTKNLSTYIMNIL